MFSSYEDIHISTWVSRRHKADCVFFFTMQRSPGSVFLAPWKQDFTRLLRIGEQFQFTID